MIRSSITAHAPHPRLGVALLSATISLAAAGMAFALPPVSCLVPDNGGGTIDYPPNPCRFVSIQPLLIVDGLPPGTTMELHVTIDSFFRYFHRARRFVGR